MSLSTSELSAADVAAVCGNNRGNDGPFGGDNAWWIIILLLFGYGGRGFGFGGGMGAGAACGVPCATQADVRAAVDQQTLISKLDQQTYGIADSTYALNSAVTAGFHGVDNALCSLGYTSRAASTLFLRSLHSAAATTEQLSQMLSTRWPQIPAPFRTPFRIPQEMLLITPTRTAEQFSTSSCRTRSPL